MNPKRAKHILILRSNPVAPDSRVEKTAQTLHEAGYRVTVLCWDRTGDKPLTEEKAFCRVERVRIKAGFGVGSKQTHKVLQFWLWLFWKVLTGKYDAVHACDFDTAFPAFLAAWLRRKRRVFDIFDMYSQGGNVPASLKPLIEKFERFTMRLAHRIIVVDDNRLGDIPVELKEKIVIIYNTPPDVYGKTAEPVFPKTKDTFRIVYTGQLNEGRYLLEVATAVSKVPEVELIMAGFGSPEWEERLTTHIKGVKNIAWLGKLGYAQALVLESSADALFAFYDTKIPQNKLASSNKLFEALMLAKPILVSAGTSMDQIVKYFNCGYVLENMSEAELIRMFKSLAADPWAAAKHGERGREAYLKHYSFDLMRQRLQAIYG